jgi:anti-anti-sigma factor
MSTNVSAMTGLPQLTIEVRSPSSTVARVVVRGEVDVTTAAALRDRLLCVLRDRTPAIIQVDLAGVGFLDCTGIDVLVAVHNAAARSGCPLRIIHPQHIVRRILEVTGLLGVLTGPIERWQPLPARIQIPAGDWIGYGHGGATDLG